MRKKFIFFFFLICSIAFVQSCKKNNTPSTLPPSQPPPPVEVNYTSEYKYNLNIIYFVAADRQPNDEYHKHLSKILLDGQAVV